MPVYQDPDDANYQIEVLPPKVYLCGSGCSVTERISRRIGMIKDPSGQAFFDPELSARTGIVVRGANLKGESSAASGWDKADTSAKATGWERHKYEVFVPDECEFSECTIKVKCNAHGSLRGSVTDHDNASAMGSASVTACGSDFPLELDIQAKPAPSEGKTHITAHGETDAEHASGDFTYDYEAKKISDHSDIEQMPNVSVPSTHSCMDGTFELEAVTSVTLSAHAGGAWTTQTAKMTAEFENYIRTIEVICKCTCPHAVGNGTKQPKTDDSKKDQGSVPKEQQKDQEKQMKTLKSALEEARKIEKTATDELRNSDPLSRKAVVQAERASDAIFTVPQFKEVRALTTLIQGEKQPSGAAELRLGKASASARMFEWLIQETEQGFTITGRR